MIINNVDVASILSHININDTIKILDNINNTFKDQSLTKINNVIITTTETPYSINSLKDALITVLSNEETQYDQKDFEFINKLGEGSYGDIFLFKLSHETSYFVIKRINYFNKSLPREVVMNEIEILKHLSPYCSQYILCYIGSTYDRKNYYIVTEYLGQHITLEKYISNFKGTQSPTMTLTIIKNLVDGLNLIHSYNVTHRDIKPDNIMINPTTGDIKYIDFGVSCMIPNCDSQDIQGTLIYLAPEVYTKSVTFSFQTWVQSDIWSLGMTIFKLITAANYYDTYLAFIYLPDLFKRNRYDVYKLTEPDVIDIIVYDIIRSTLSEPTPLLLSEFLIDHYFLPLLEMMLQKDPYRRHLPSI